MRSLISDPSPFSIGIDHDGTLWVQVGGRRLMCGHVQPGLPLANERGDRFTPKLRSQSVKFQGLRTSDQRIFLVFRGEFVNLSSLRYFSVRPQTTPPYLSIDTSVVLSRAEAEKLVPLQDGEIKARLEGSTELISLIWRPHFDGDDDPTSSSNSLNNFDRLFQPLPEPGHDFEPRCMVGDGLFVKDAGSIWIAVPFTDGELRELTSQL